MHPERHSQAAYDGALPRAPRPIVIIGTGGIVKDAHLPAYRKAGYPVWGLVNRTILRARLLADEYGIAHVFDTVSAAVAQAPPDAVYDIALMPEQYLETLEQLPEGAAVLIQKPLGHSLDEARALQEVCTRRRLVAAVNTQLRFAPYVQEARKLIADGAIGEVYDFELRVSVETPWDLFPHVFGMPRLEFTMHSVHYMDLVRSFFGDPDGVSATTVRHPQKPDVATTRSTIIMRYRDRDLRAVISTNHDHDLGPRYEESFIKWEGTEGAIRAQMGLLLDYPDGGPDSLEITRREDGKVWHPVPFDGSWFPDAFMGSMGVLQRFVAGEIPQLPTSVDDVVKTMAVVEAAYRSEEAEGIAPDPDGGVACAPAAAATDTRRTMKRVASIIGVRPEHIAEYEAYHADVWPEVLAAITASNITNYSIYRHGDLLFSYYEYVGDDYEADMAKMAADPTTQKWWSVQEPLQRRLDGTPHGEWWMPVAEVFHHE